MGFKFLWFDFWIGIYIDRAKRLIYICPLPCCVFWFKLSWLRFKLSKLRKEKS